MPGTDASAQFLLNFYPSPCLTLSLLQFHKTLQFFGEDYATTDEFLQVFDTFFVNFHEARIENENLRKRKEDENKRAENATVSKTHKQSI